MHFETSKLKGWLIGDPHLGRDFRNGTPLHRRGEREAMQLAQFKEELATPDVDVIVMVGDLFDKPFVPLPVINEAVAAVVDAARYRPIHFVFQAGNHDISRQTSIKGAWELFSVAVSWLDNVTVLNQPGQFGDIAFFPWEWVGTAEMQVEYFNPLGPIHTAIGHWDTSDFGNTDHMVPVLKLQEKLGANIEIYTGHDHEVGDKRINGVNVHRTGSMQPYTHAEDPSGEIYVTLTCEKIAEIDPDTLRNKCVRVILEPGEILPEIDCLQLTVKKTDELQEVELGEVTIGNFDIHAVLDEEFVENEVPEPVQGFIKERLGAFA